MLWLRTTSSEFIYGNHLFLRLNLISPHRKRFYSEELICSDLPSENKIYTDSQKPSNIVTKFLNRRERIRLTLRKILI